MTTTLTQLRDGEYHRLEQLAARLGDAPEQTAERLEQLAALGVPVEYHERRGFRLREAVRPLDAKRITAVLRAAGIVAADRLHVVEQIDSTNRFLMAWPQSSELRERVCVAECQLAGRGRRGRAWRDAAFRNVKLSVGWTRPPGAAPAHGLTLAAGVVVARALENSGLAGVGLKWPNDVMWSGRKVAGILTDAAMVADGSTRLVVGVGVNVCAPSGPDAIGQPWASLGDAGLGDVDRDRLCAGLILELVRMLHRFDRDGFAPWRPDFEQRHIYNRKTVSVSGLADVVSGTVCGVDAQGALRLRCDDKGVVSVTAGEVSLRGYDPVVSA